MLGLSHLWHHDLELSAVGDLLTADGTALGQQRVLRRLLTNPGDYIWHPEYGAGLPRFVGDVIDVRKIRGVIRSQIFLEAAVARIPEPQIDLELIPNGLSVSIRYVDAPSRTPVLLAFDINR